MKMVKTVSANSTMLAAKLLAAAACGALVAAPSAMAQKPITVAAPAGAPMSFADLIDRVSPAVVSVVVTTEVPKSRLERTFNPFRGLPGFDEYEDRFGKQDEEGGDEGEPEQDEEGRSLGSGFFISSNGYIATNNHVVENAREVVVTLKGGEELEAEIVGTDEQTDLAVLKVKKSGSYPYVEFATKAKPRVGDWVVALGNPFGLGGTATAGIVSADGRELTGGNYNDFIQVDAPINRGNSGGPTFNLQGQVIGVNTAIFSDTGGGSVGIGFAIEAAAAQKITETLIKNGKVVRGWLGVEIQSMDRNLAEALDLKSSNGAIVRKVTAGGPAEASGIKREDIVIAVNDEEVKDSRDLTQRVGSLLAGSKNSFKVIREGKEMTISVTVKERDPKLGQNAAPQPRPETEPPKSAAGDVKVLGGTVRPLTAAEAKPFELPAGTGLLVVTVERRGSLGSAQILPGDALLAASGKPLKTPKDLQDAVAEAIAEKKENIALSVGRGETTTLLAVEIKPE
jgi:serine protease Do